MYVEFNWKVANKPILIFIYLMYVTADIIMNEQDIDYNLRKELTERRD